MASLTLSWKVRECRQEFAEIVFQHENLTGTKLLTVLKEQYQQQFVLLTGM